MKRKVAIVTNNLHCERHVQYYATIEKYLKTNGWSISEDFNVEKIIIVACGFHDSMYEKVLRILQHLRKIHFLEKNIIIMGCLAKTHEQNLETNFNGYRILLDNEHLLDDIIRAEVPFAGIIPVNQLRMEREAGEQKKDKMFYIKIARGCLRRCTFCVINKAKGYIRSVPVPVIVSQFKMAMAIGINKVFLMGEDTFAYGIDIGTSIIELIETLAVLEPRMRLNFGYLHIRWLQEYAKDIISLCRRGIIRELHIGLQHVNDKMLRRMGRPALFSRLYDIIGTIKKEIPSFYMAADIIVGFPGETKEIFNEMAEFFKNDHCFNKIRHSAYSDVKGAPSTRLKDKISPAEIRSRWEYLGKILGERSSFNQVDDTSRLDDTTYKLTQEKDYVFCMNTFSEPIEETAINPDMVEAKSNILEDEKGDFGF